jgi:predicted aspartyl protease
MHDVSVDGMGIYRTNVEISRDYPAGAQVRIDNAMVDTGAEYSWIPSALLEQVGIARVKVLRFITADARVVERSAGYGFVHAAGESSPTVLIFAEPGDQTLLGAHALEGMNLRVDLVEKRLIPAGPVSAAAA